jgi:hypothetical protein
MRDAAILVDGLSRRSMRESRSGERTSCDVDESISPELALVDPSLRASAIAALPPLEAFDVLLLRASARRQANALVAAAPAAGPPSRTAPSLPVAAALYTVGAIVRVALFDLSLMLALVLVIVALTLLR